MSTPIIILLILLAIDSIYALYASYNKKWLALAISVGILLTLNFLIKYLHNG